MTIRSAAEFSRLRRSEDPADYHRAAHENASMDVWRDVISNYPDLRLWVAHNKTVPIAVLAMLAADPDPEVRNMVSLKHKLTPELLEILAGDADALVRANVARHPKVPQSVLDRLALDKSRVVREIVALRSQADQGER
jgi:hypothetical protein